MSSYSPQFIPPQPPAQFYPMPPTASPFSPPPPPPSMTVQPQFRPPPWAPPVQPTYRIPVQAAQVPTPSPAPAHFNPMPMTATQVAPWSPMHFPVPAALPWNPVGYFGYFPDPGMQNVWALPAALHPQQAGESFTRRLFIEGSRAVGEAILKTALAAIRQAVFAPQPEFLRAPQPAQQVVDVTPQQ